MPGQAARNALASSSDSTRGAAQPDAPRGRVVEDEPGVQRGGGHGPETSAVRSSPISRPSPRTSVTRGSAASPSRSFCPRTVACSSRPSSSMVRITASAAAHATGLPPNVVPCWPGSSRSPAAPRPMQAPIGMPPPRPLASGDHVRDDAAGLRARTTAGAADPGLHLVEPEQRAVLVGDAAGGGQVALGRDDDAGLALDRLQQHGRGLVGHRGGERVRVAERHEGDVSRQRFERRRGRPPWT